MSPVERLVDTPHGAARVVEHRAVAVGADHRATLVLGHGAGAGVDTADLRGLARALPGLGVDVVLLEQPWVLAGRRVAAPARVLDEVTTEVVGSLDVTDGPVVLGGRSTGARVACRTAAALGVRAVVCLAYPLVPPSRAGADPARTAAKVADRSRELAGAGVPTLVLQGSRDRFGDAEAIRRAVPSARVVEVADADHSLAVRRGAPDPLATVVTAVATFIDGLSGPDDVGPSRG